MCGRYTITTPIKELATYFEVSLPAELFMSTDVRNAETSSAMVSSIERGTYQPGKYVLEKISKALECQIPAELYPLPRERKSRIGQRNLMGAPQTVMIHMSDQNIADFNKKSSVQLLNTCNTPQIFSGVY